MATRKSKASTVAPDDFSGATASLDKTAYTKGAAAKWTLAGTVIAQIPWGVTTLHLVAQDGTLFDLSVPSGATVATSIPFKIASVTDAAGRTFVVAADGQSATTTA